MIISLLGSIFFLIDVIDTITFVIDSVTLYVLYTGKLKSVVTGFLTSIGMDDLIPQSYDESAYELLPSPQAEILLEAVKQWDILIKGEDAK